MMFRSENTHPGVSTVHPARPILAGILLFIINLTAQHSFAQQTSQPDLMETENQARILIRSSERVEVRTEIYASVLEIPFGAGQQFKAGDILIRFDCARYDAEKNAAAASANAASIEHQTKRKLFKYKAAGKDEVRLAAALAAKSNAELKVQQIRFQQCEYRAPFDGRIVDQIVKVHEFPSTSEPLLTILNDSQLELQLVVPSRWLRWVKKGMKFRFKIDETGETHKGTIVRLGAEVDPVSQTIRLLGKFESPATRVLAGMSGTAYFAAGS
ncbi:MAG: efflux RND transporter periplasmic adaptor subunit [Rhizobiaceae bacterium]|nr:efflux RND transporter periplasmic adaptor subunit [Rhizobiaceae bacterium]